MNLPLVTIVLATLVVVVKNHECKDYVLSASDQSLIDMMTHYLHTSRKEESAHHASKPADKGVTYVHWGKKSCPKGADIVYTGQVGGNDVSNKGGGVNYLCLPDDPENGQHQSYNNNQVYGGEYELSSPAKPSGWSESMANKEVPCAVCYQKHRSTVLMIPGRKTCYKGWTSEYQGYLLSDHINHLKKTSLALIEMQNRVTFVRWGKKNCPKEADIVHTGRKVIGYKGWTSAYHGYLMSDHKSHYKKRLRMRRQECRTIGQSEWK
ncbi:unnamed protein product [Mytilus edulis]|uniref:Uncharacterized protein n=1 Tax=Mytilus edulis TaxID=6550 RepID=A0A8S3UGH4_MYTED|nr:unnamed protein product [Mytilus edulis]